MQTIPLRIFASTLCLAAASAFAGSATWNAVPIPPLNGDWNTASHWSPNTVPNGPADIGTFNSSSVTAVSFSADTEVNGIVFNAAAVTAYTFTIGFPRTLTISGAGITNNSATTQNFVTTDNGPANVGIIYFTNSAVAGSRTVFSGGGVTAFQGSASADHGTFIHPGATNSTGVGGVTTFANNSTAGNGIFTENAATVSGGRGGSTQFFDSSSAGNGTFTINGGAGSRGFVLFANSSSAGNGGFTINGGTVAGAIGGSVSVFANATAANGTFTANGGAALSALGGLINFEGNGTAGNATLIANGGTNGGEGGVVRFRADSTGGTARVQVSGNGRVDIGFRNSPGVTIGSVEGSGNVFLGNNNLSVGSNNLSTTFSGVMQDGGENPNATGASLTKIGTGTLTLSGVNTYTGATTVSGGTLRVDGSIVSNTTIQNGGTLGGIGTVRGITLQSGGNLAPGDSPGTLHGSSLVWNGGGFLTFELGPTPLLSDFLDLSGSLTKGTPGAFTFSFLNGGLLFGQTYDLIGFGNTNFAATDFSFMGDGSFGGSFAINANRLQFTPTGVPEPSSSWTLLALGLAGLALIRSRTTGTNR